MVHRLIFAMRYLRRHKGGGAQQAALRRLYASSAALFKRQIKWRGRPSPPCHFDQARLKAERVEKSRSAGGVQKGEIQKITTAQNNIFAYRKPQNSYRM